MPKILIFESEDLLRNMYVVKYRQAGFEVSDYKHPSPDPVSIVLKEKPDIISSDIIMYTRDSARAMDGFKAIQLLKANSRTKDIPIFFLTNLGQIDDQRKGRALGAVEYLVKADNTPDDVVNYAKSILGLPHQIVETRPERIKKGRRFLDRLLGRKP